MRHSLATDFRVGKASQTERVRRPAVAIELCSSISRLGNSSKLDCARLDEMVGNLRLRVTGESRKRLLGSNRIEREAAPANVRGGTKRLSTIRYSGSEFRGRIFRFGISGPRGERTETYLPTRLSGERRRAKYTDGRAPLFSCVDEVENNLSAKVPLDLFDGRCVRRCRSPTADLHELRRIAGGGANFRHGTLQGYLAEKHE